MFERSCIAFTTIKLGPADSFVHLKKFHSSFIKKYLIRSLIIQNFALENKILKKNFGFIVIYIIICKTRNDALYQEVLLIKML